MKIDPATFADGLADIIEKVVRPLRDEIAATRKGVTLLPADAAGLGADLGQETKRQIERALSPILARLSYLENRPSTNYRGTFAEGETYSRGDLLTHDGGCWFCCAETSSRPGRSPDWKLMLKAGGR